MWSYGSPATAGEAKRCPDSLDAATWQQIGAALNTARQAAHQRDATDGNDE